MTRNAIPFVAVDAVTLLTGVDSPVLINRDPEPDETGIPSDAEISFEVVDLGTSGVSLADTTVRIGGKLAFDGSDATPFQDGFSGTYTLSVDTFGISIAPTSPFVSRSVVSVVIETELNDGTAGSWTYSFTVEDVTVPVVSSAEAWGQKVVRVTFGNPVVGADFSQVSSVTAAMPWGEEPVVNEGGEWLVSRVSVPWVVSNTGPFALADYDYLDVAIGGVPQRVTLRSSMFPDIGAASADELAAALDTLVEGGRAISLGGKVWLEADDADSSIVVVNATGHCNQAIGFSALEKTKRLRFGTAPGEYEVTFSIEYASGSFGSRVLDCELYDAMDPLVLEDYTETLDGVTALDPANYAVVRHNVYPSPGVGYEVTDSRPSPIVGVTLVSNGVVDVELDIPMTPGCPYELVVTDVEDAYGNEVASPWNSALFTGWEPPVPEGRRFRVYDMLPQMNRDDDTLAQLEAFANCLQEVIDLALYDVDSFPEIASIHDAGEAFVDAMLYQLGNPFFWIEMDLNMKRKVALNLVPLYKLKGTEEGIKAALRLLMGVEVDIGPLNDRSVVWTLGVPALSTLRTESAGTSLILGDGSRRAAFSFVVELVSIGGVLRRLTDSEYSILSRIVNYMKPVNMHFARFDQPALPVELSGWIMDVSVLGVGTVLT